jgi:hypothetical protein
VIGSARHGEDENAPEELLVSKIKIKYPQHELDQCFIRGVAFSLYYCGLTQASWRLCDTAHTFKWLTKTFALKELKNVMKNMPPASVFAKSTMCVARIGKSRNFPSKTC